VVELGADYEAKVFNKVVCLRQNLLECMHPYRHCVRILYLFEDVVVVVVVDVVVVVVVVVAAAAAVVVVVVAAVVVVVVVDDDDDVVVVDFVCIASHTQPSSQSPIATWSSLASVRAALSMRPSRPRRRSNRRPPSVM
jgi:hypothetical protein